jgi:hypothetical protein
LIDEDEGLPDEDMQDGIVEEKEDIVVGNRDRGAQMGKIVNDAMRIQD